MSDPVTANSAPTLDAGPQRAGWLTWGSEIVFLCCALAVANAVFAPSDVGWLRAQPHPAFLVPLLIAARYGFVQGAVAGLAVAALHALAQLRVGPIQWLDPALLFFLGAGLGELRQRQRMREEDQRRRAEVAKAEQDALAEALQVERKARRYLERRIVEPTTSLATLFQSAQRLETLDVAALYPAVLGILADHLEAKVAASYALSAGELSLRAVRGAEREEAETWTDDPLLSLAISKGEACSLRDLPPAEREPTDSSLAAPLLTERGEVLGVVVIRDLPFVRLTRDATRTVGLLGQWAGRALRRARYVARIREGVVFDEARGVLRASYFQARLEDESARARRYKHPLSLFLLVIERWEDMTESSRDRILLALAGLLLEAFRGVDQIFCDPQRKRFLALLPHSDGAGAKLVRQRVVDRLALLDLYPYRDPELPLEVSLGTSSQEVSEGAAPPSCQELLERAEQLAERAPGQRTRPRKRGSASE